MPDVLQIMLGAGAANIALSFMLAGRSRRRRSRAIEGVAHAHGWTFSRRDHRRHAHGLGIGPFRSLAVARSSNLVERTDDVGNGRLFDAYFKTARAGYPTRAWATCAVVEMNEASTPFVVRRRARRDAITAWVGPAPIETGSADFDAAFRLWADDGDHALELLDTDRQAWLMEANMPGTVEVSGKIVLVTHDGFLEAERIPALLAFATAVAELLT